MQNTINPYLAKFDQLADIQLYRPAEVCGILRISLASFWRLTRAGKLRTFKLAERTTVVRASDLREFIASREAA